MQLKLFDDGALSKPAAALLAAAAIAAPALAARADRPTPRNLGTRIWYALLRKPAFTPPDRVYPLVWSAIDGALAIGAWRLARKPATPQRNRALGLLGANVALIAGWSKLFFGKRRLGGAAVGSAAIAATAAAYVAAARPVDKSAAAAGVPLVAWVGFATVLATTIWKMNRR